jgi:murein DD-endopeptidase MepM/ murein hydrolase activator NlpD
MKTLLLLSLILLAGSPAVATLEVDLRGSFIQGGLVHGRTCPACRVSLQKRDVPVSPRGEFIIGFGRDSRLHQELLVRTPDGTTLRRPLQLLQREYQVQRIDGISRQMMQPAAEELERIAREAREIAAVRLINSDLEHFLEPFAWPLTGRVTGVYGSQRILNGEPRQPHYGIDIAAPTGTPVRAPAGGVVTLVHPEMFYAGTTLVIDHGHGLSSTFLHLDEILVDLGRTVAKGEIVATVGATGRVTGPHLDWRVNWFDERLDPALLTGAMAE